MSGDEGNWVPSMPDTGWHITGITSSTSANSAIVIVVSSDLDAEKKRQLTHFLLKKEGVGMNQKRFRRLYREEGRAGREIGGLHHSDCLAGNNPPPLRVVDKFLKRLDTAALAPISSTTPSGHCLTQFRGCCPPRDERGQLASCRMTCDSQRRERGLLIAGIAGIA
jgi:hypothetical protein